MNKEEANQSRVTPPTAAFPKGGKSPAVEKTEKWVLDGNVEISRSFDVTTVRQTRS